MDSPNAQVIFSSIKPVLLFAAASLFWSRLGSSFYSIVYPLIFLYWRCIFSWWLSSISCLGQWFLYMVYSPSFFVLNPSQWNTQTQIWSDLSVVKQFFFFFFTNYLSIHMVACTTTWLCGLDGISFHFGILLITFISLYLTFIFVYKYIDSYTKRYQLLSKFDSHLMIIEQKHDFKRIKQTFSYRMRKCFKPNLSVQ